MYVCRINLPYYNLDSDLDNNQTIETAVAMVGKESHWIIADTMIHHNISIE